MWETRVFVSLAMHAGSREEVGIDLWHRRKDEVIGPCFEQPDELLPFKTAKFGTFENIPIPSGSESYLDRVYRFYFLCGGGGGGVFFFFFFFF